MPINTVSAKTPTTVKSLADTGANYLPFVFEVQADGKVFVIATNSDGTVRAEANVQFPAGCKLPVGLTVAQGRRYDTLVHVQIKGAKGNRAYGWAFETADPALKFIVQL